MNLAPSSRPRRWSPQVILFAVTLHAVILYYIAASFHIVPSLVDPTPEPPAIRTVFYTPPPPPIDKPEPVVDQHPLFHQRPTVTPPIQTTVPPSPLTPTTTPDTGPATIMVGTPIGDEPIARALPNYPFAAIRDDKEGVVFLSITIMPDGSVRDVEIVNAKPHGYFEESAIRSVRTWRYAPSNLIRKNVIVRMDFQLKG